MAKQFVAVFYWYLVLLIRIFSIDSNALSASSTPMSRRNMVFVGAAGAAVCGSTTKISMKTSTVTTTLSLNEAVQWIDNFCDRKFLRAIVASEYRFLYRGEAPTMGIRTLQSRPDLLDIETYGSLTALKHFQQLENLMRNEAVRPSNGHLATTSEQGAGLWGEACSVWPRQASNFAWFQHGGLFYPRDLSLDNLLIDGRDCGEEALQDLLMYHKAEVLFSTDEYLVVPAKFDRNLRLQLQESFLI